MGLSSLHYTVNYKSSVAYIVLHMVQYVSLNCGYLAKYVSDSTFGFLKYTEQQELNSNLLEWTRCPRLSESTWLMVPVVADILHWAHTRPAEPLPQVSSLRFKGLFFSHCHGSAPIYCWSIWPSHSQDSMIHSVNTLMGYWLRVNVVVQDFLRSHLCSTTY